MTPPLPRMRRVRQNFPSSAPLDLPAAVAAALEKLRPRIRPGARLAVGVGSRGITRLPEIVAATLAELRRAGAHPFIVPAMGSHGGATPGGQRGILAEYGVTEEAMGVPIRDSMEVRQIGISADGLPVVCSVEALDADGILLVNRIKPHTDFFSETLGSGLLKMAVIGLGKRVGAAAMHRAAPHLGYEHVIRGLARVVLRAAPLIGGLAILEDQHHAPARLVALEAGEFETGEAALLAEARALMPRLPWAEIDLLIIDRIGKNISGTGMDTNVVQRHVDGYSASLRREARPAPFIRRIFVRDLTAETKGNAAGIGLADFTTTRLMRAIDPRVTALNALTSLTPQSVKVPIWFDTDREAIERAVATLALPEGVGPRIAWIADTLSLAEMRVSEALWDELAADPRLTWIEGGSEFEFDGDGNLVGG